MKVIPIRDKDDEEYYEKTGTRRLKAKAYHRYLVKEAEKERDYVSKDLEEALAHFSAAPEDTSAVADIETLRKRLVSLNILISQLKSNYWERI